MHSTSTKEQLFLCFSSGPLKTVRVGVRVGVRVRVRVRVSVRVRFNFHSHISFELPVVHNDVFGTIGEGRFTASLVVPKTLLIFVFQTRLRLGLRLIT